MRIEDGTVYEPSKIHTIKSGSNTVSTEADDRKRKSANAAGASSACAHPTAGRTDR